MKNKILLSSLACISFYTTQAQHSSKLHNIIFILADDIGYADFSCYGAKTIAFAGSVTKDAAACNQAGIDAFFPIVRGITTLEEAMDTETAKYNMRSCAEQVFRLL